MSSSIFFEFNLPNSSTWFYLSLFLTVSLFFQFNRLLSLRNWDLLALFLFVPGFLLIQESHRESLAARELSELRESSSVSDRAGRDSHEETPANDRRRDITNKKDAAERERLGGYAALMGASMFWFIRCMIDLGTTKRPLMTSNLTTPGLFCLGGSLFICLVSVAYARPTDPWEPVGKLPLALTEVQASVASALQARAEVPSGPEALFWVERTFAMICHSLVVLGLVMIGVRRFNDLATGVAAGTLYLLLPYTAYHIGQMHHVWPAYLITWAMFWYRRPGIAGSLIGLAAGTVFFPILMMPVWLQFYRGRGALRFLIAALLTMLVGLAASTAMSTLGDLPDTRTLNLSDWEPWKVPTEESLWTGVPWAYRIPVFILFTVFVSTSFLWPPVRNLGHLTAMCAAVAIGIQFWYADRGGLYVLWYSPFLILMVLRPNLADQEPSLPPPWPGFVIRAGRKLVDWVFYPSTFVVRHFVGRVMRGMAQQSQTQS